MKVLNILCCGGVGGVETLCKNYGVYSAHENKFICIWEPGAVSEEMNKLGIQVDVYNTRPTRYLADFQRLKRDIEENAYDALIIHQMAPLISVYLFLIRIRFPELKILTYVHSNAYDWSTRGFRRKMDMVLKKMSYKKSEKTVCISESVKQSVIDVMGVNADKLIVIYNGVDCSQFRLREESTLNKTTRAETLLQGKSQDRLNIIYVGRLEKVKGVQNILLALSKVEVPYIFRIVGDGNYKKELEVLSGRLGITDHVCFLGTRRDVPSLLCQSGIFIHIPDCQEGFGITVIEAMAAGCICIVNDHGALPEIVENKVNGFVITDNVEDKVAALITDIWIKQYENEFGNVLRKIRENARARAEQFSIENFTNELDKTLERL